MMNGFTDKYIRRRKDILCIAVSGSSLQAVMCSGAGEMAVLRAVETALPDTAAGLLRDEKALAEKVAALLAENGLSRAGGLVFVLDTETVMLQRLLLPELPDGELREAVKWEISESLPFAGEECCLDLFTASAQDGMQAVQLAAVPQKLIGCLQAAAELLQLPLLTVTAAPLAQAAFVQQQRGNFLLLQADGAFMRLTAFVDGMPVAFFSADMEEDAGAAISDAAAKVREKYGVRLRSVFYDAGCASCRNWQEGVQELAGEEYCLSPLAFEGAISWQGTFLTDEEQSRYASRYMTAVGGCLLAAGGAKSIDFIRSTVRKTRFGQNKLLRALTAIIVLGMLLVWGGVYACSLYEAEKISRLQRELDALAVWQERCRQAEQINESIREHEFLLTGLERRSVKWASVLEQLGRTVPESCWLSRVQQKGEGAEKELLLYGKAESLEAAEALLTELRTCKEFAGAELAETGSETDNGIISWAVRINMGGKQDE